jgi:hypothetical protein
VLDKRGTLAWRAREFASRRANSRPGVIASSRDHHTPATQVAQLGVMDQLAEVGLFASPAAARQASAASATTTAVSVLAATALLASAALYNGYPLTFWDTGSYLESAATLMPRADRLIGYSFLLRAASWTGTLWPVVSAQCALVAWLIRRVLARLRPELGVAGYLTRVGLLAGCTALPWIAGQLMADIFTPLLVLALWLYVEDESLSGAQRAALLAMIALCVSVHLTHLPLGLALIGLAWLGLRAQQLRRRLLAPAVALLVGLAAIGGWNAARVGHFTLASGSDTFLLGHLVDTGIASRMLDAHCPQRDYWLCPHRTRLPMASDELLWVDALGLQPWQHPAAVSREVSRLLRDSLREVPLLHAQVALLSTLRALGRFATGEGLDGDARPEIEPHLQKLAPGDVQGFAASRQQRDAIAVAQLRQLHTPIGWALIALALGALARSLQRTALATPLLRFLAFVAAAWLLNAVLSANLSGIFDRYESRLLWLFGLGLSAWPKLPGRDRAAHPSQLRARA